jgi:hypothetical protein
LSGGHAACAIAEEDERSGLKVAADWQLGAITRTYREWRVSGDTQWMRKLWPKVRLSLD